MIEDMRKYVEAGLGSLTPSRAKDMARSLLQGQGTEQINRVAGTLMEWSRRSRERITELVQSEVKRQLRAVGVATRDDLDALRKRVRDLEKAPSAAPAPASRSSARRPSAAKKSAAKKSTAKKSTAKRSPAKRAGSSSSGTSGSSPGSGSSS